MKGQLARRIERLFTSEDEAQGVATAAVASAEQMENCADHLWSTVLHIHEQLGRRATTLLAPTHQLVLAVRELADQLVYGPLVASSIGIIKGLNASQLLDKVEAVCRELDKVYRIAEQLPVSDVESRQLADRRERAATEDEETAKEQSEEDEYERLIRRFDAFMASFGPVDFPVRSKPA